LVVTTTKGHNRVKSCHSQLGPFGPFLRIAIRQFGRIDKRSIGLDGVLVGRRRLRASQRPYHVEIFLSHYPLGVFCMKLVQPFGNCRIYLHQERYALGPELSATIAPRFNQFAAVAIALTRRAHAEGIKVKPGRFWFGRDVITGIARLLSSGALDWYI
jgi:hypothetical protein